MRKKKLFNQIHNAVFAGIIPLLDTFLSTLPLHLRWKGLTEILKLKKDQSGAIPGEWIVCILPRLLLPGSNSLPLCGSYPEV